MALDFFTGFDHYATADLTLGRFTSNTGTTVQSAVARNGGQALSLSGVSQFIIHTGLSNQSTRVLGFAFRMTVLPAAGRAIAHLADGTPATAANVQVSLQVETDGKLSVWRGRGLNNSTAGTQLGSSSASVLSANTWYYIELVATVHSSAGTVEVFVNNSKSGWIDLTGQNTQSTGSAQANAFSFGGLNTNTIYVDDVHLLGGSGGVRTARLGDVKCTARVASAGDGIVAQFTPSSGSDNGAMVDENPANGDTDYNESASPGNIDTYAYPAFGITGTIYGVQTLNYIRKTDAGTCDAQSGIRINGTNYLGTQTPVGESYVYLVDMREQSPDTASNYTFVELDDAGTETLIKHSA